MAGLIHHLVFAYPISLPWYLTRTAAISAYIALSTTVILGILRPLARATGDRLSWITDELHQFVALLAGLLALGHLVTLKVDEFIPFTIKNLLLPGDQPYSPFATNLGVFAAYSFIIVLLTSWLRGRIPYPLWRTLHYLSFVTFVLVSLHGWLGGSDSGEPWTHALYVGMSTTVGFLVLMRLFFRPSKTRAVEAEA